MSILEQIFEAGVVGCGGAGFPAHAKLSGRGIGHLILNGAECEPLLGTDRWLMRNRADDIVGAAAAVAKEIGAKEKDIQPGECRPGDGHPEAAPFRRPGVHPRHGKLLPRRG